MNLILVSCYLNRIARKMPGKCKKAICSYNFPNLLCSKFYPSVCYLFSRFTWLENRVSQKRLQILGLTASNLQTFFSTPCFPASWTWKTSNSHMEKFSALQIWKIIGTKYYFLINFWFKHCRHLLFDVNFDTNLWASEVIYINVSSYFF